MLSRLRIHGLPACHDVSMGSPCGLENSLLLPSTATKSKDVQGSRTCWISAWEGTCLHDEVINEKGVDQAQHGVHSPPRTYVFLHTTS